MITDCLLARADVEKTATALDAGTHTVVSSSVQQCYEQQRYQWWYKSSKSQSASACSYSVECCSVLENTNYAAVARTVRCSNSRIAGRSSVMQVVVSSSGGSAVSLMQHEQCSYLDICLVVVYW